VESNRAVGRSRGGRTIRIHALTDTDCRPIASMLTGGRVDDCGASGAEAAINDLSHHQGYAGDAIRRQIKERGMMPHPPESEPGLEDLLLVPPLPQEKRHQTDVRRLKGFCGFAKRYDCSAANFLGAAVSYG
jgi:transposase